MLAVDAMGPRLAAARRWLAPGLAAVLAACAAAGRPAAPLATTAPLDEDDDDAPALLRRAEAELSSGSPDGAAALFDRAAALRPTDDAPLLGAARARLAAADAPAALAALDRALALRESAQGRALRGRALAGQRRWDAARQELERALAVAPGDAGAWALLAVVELHRGDRTEAARAYGRAAALVPPTDAARVAWRELRFLPPDPIQPEESLDRCTRGAVALLEGQPAEALREATNGLRFAPRFAWCAAVAAEARWRTGDGAAAELLLRQALPQYGPGQEPLRADAGGLLAELLSSRREGAAEAVGLARDALAVRGDRLTLLVALARACEATGDRPCVRDASARLLALPRLPETLRAQVEERLR